MPDPTPYLAITGAALRGVSRDGKTVLFLMQRDTVAQLFRTSPDGGWPTRLTFRPDGVDFASLSPDGTRVVVGWDRDGDENYGLYLVSTTEPASANVPRSKRVWSNRAMFRRGTPGTAIWPPWV